MSPPGTGRDLHSFRGLGYLCLSLANLPATRPQDLDNLGRHGGREWDADKDEALVDSVSQCELGCKTWQIVSVESFKRDKSLVKHGDAEHRLESQESSSSDIPKYKGRCVPKCKCNKTGNWSTYSHLPCVPLEPSQRPSQPSRCLRTRDCRRVPPSRHPWLRRANHAIAAGCSRE